MSDMVPVELSEIQFIDDPRQSQVVVLAETEGSREFQIYIHWMEAAAIDNALHNIVSRRPLTHDLILNVIKELNYSLVAVQVDDLREDEAGGGTFYGKLVLENLDGDQMLVDCRPSDSLVLASKTKVPVFVADHVLELCGKIPEDQAEPDPDSFE